MEVALGLRGEGRLAAKPITVESVQMLGAELTVPDVRARPEVLAIFFCEVETAVRSIHKRH